MFERFTPDARQVVVFAQDEARALGHGSIGSEHLLLAVLRVDRGVAARGLKTLGLSLDRARAEVEKIAGRGSAAPHGQIPFEPRLRRTLDIAMSEAMSLGHEAVGTEHLALALIAEREGITARLLESVAAPEALRAAVLEVLAAPPDADEAPLPPVAGAPKAIVVTVGDDVQSLLRRAGSLALAEEASSVSLEHVRRALDQDH